MKTFFSFFIIFGGLFNLFDGQLFVMLDGLYLAAVYAVAFVLFLILFDTIGFHNLLLEAEEDKAFMKKLISSSVCVVLGAALTGHFCAATVFALSASVLTTILYTKGHNRD